MARSLWPREHGTYVQLLAPLIAALLVRMPAVASVLLAVAAGAAFLGTEAMLVARGGRGPRRREIDGARAARRARTCGAIAVGAAGAGLILAPQPAVELAGLVALPATLSLILAVRRQIHTMAGELVAAAALAGVSAPVAAASGMSRTDALVSWLAWSAGFATVVVAVRAVIARHRKRAKSPELAARTDAHVIAFALVTVLVIVQPRMAIALPLVFASVMISMVAPGARRLMAVGIALAIASGVSMVIAVAIG